MSKNKEIQAKSVKKYHKSDKGKKALEKANEKYLTTDVGKENVAKSIRKYQKKFRHKVSDNKIAFDDFASIYKEICERENIPVLRYSNKLGFTHFREENYSASLATTLLLILEKGTEEDKLKFLSLLSFS